MVTNDAMDADMGYGYSDSVQVKGIFDIYVKQVPCDV
jgi:hypothetical protein